MSWNVRSLLKTRKVNLMVTLEKNQGDDLEVIRLPSPGI